jgi:hypothetical protein
MPELTVTLESSEYPELSRELVERLSAFTVGFVHLGPRNEDARLAGSGTLVACGAVRAILTADHVLNNLPRSGSFGLILPVASEGMRVHRTVIETNHVEVLRFAKTDRYSSDGPDIGAIALSRSDSSSIEVNHVFYNLDKRRERVLAAPRAIAMGGWSICGFADEWTSGPIETPNVGRVKVFRAAVGVGVVTKERLTSRHDYLDFEAKYGEGDESPESFEGTSGGGLWQLELKRNGDRFVVSDVLLSGVVFYQSPIVNRTRTLFCHGRRSIYEVTYEELCNSARAGAR